MILINIDDKLDDTDSVGELIRQCFPAPTGGMPELLTKDVQHKIEIEKIKYIINLIGSPRHYIRAFDTRKSNKLIGFGILSESTLQYFYDLTWVCVDIAYQGQGIGKKLVNKAIEFSQEKDRDLVITTEQTKFYSDLGFKICNEYRSGWFLMSTTSKETKI